jgi:hypothetical protein
LGWPSIRYHWTYALTPNREKGKLTKIIAPSFNNIKTEHGMRKRATIKMTKIDLITLLLDLTGKVNIEYKCYWTLHNNRKQILYYIYLDKLVVLNEGEETIHRFENLEDINFTRDDEMLSEIFPNKAFYNTSKLKDCVVRFKFTTGRVRLSTDEIDIQLMAILMKIKKIFIKTISSIGGNELWFEDSVEIGLDAESVAPQKPFTDISLLNTGIILPPYNDVFEFTDDRLIVNGNQYICNPSETPLLGYFTSAELLGPNLLKVVYHDVYRVI